MKRVGMNLDDIRPCPGSPVEGIQSAKTDSIGAGEPGPVKSRP